MLPSMQILHDWTLPNQRQPPAPPTQPAPMPEYHVGVHLHGHFPFEESRCPCPKAACGLAIPKPETYCPVHSGVRPFHQLHTASECAPRRWFRRRSAPAQRLSWHRATKF